MCEQRSLNHFEFVGLDVICDARGDCYLLEVNRLPGLETSKNRCKPEEDIVYDNMMAGVLRIALAPTKEESSANCDLWRVVHAGNAEFCNAPSDALFKNLFSWKAFTKKNRDSIVCS